jgi:hypothetical protein
MTEGAGDRFSRSSRIAGHDAAPGADRLQGDRSRRPNLAGDTLDDVAAAERGIQRIRGTPHLPFSFLRCCGLSLW